MSCDTVLHGRASHSEARFFGRRRPMHWCAPLHGVSGVKWARRFFDYILQIGPRDQLRFLFFQISIPKGSNLMQATCVKNKIGSKQQFTRCLRQFLRQPPLQLSAEAAKEFTGHSPRYFHPTVAGMRRLPLAERTAVGHWAPGSCMPVRYDSEKGWSEVAAKQDNLNMLAKSVASSGLKANSAADSAWLSWPVLHHVPPFCILLMFIFAL